MENSRSFRYKILGHVGPLGKNLNFFVSLRIAGIHDFLSFQFILKLFYSKHFHNTLNYASTANIEEVMKFYNLGDKTFETDFRKMNHVQMSDTIKPYKLDLANIFSVLYNDSSAYNFLSHLSIFNFKDLEIPASTLFVFDLFVGL